MEYISITRLNSYLKNSLESDAKLKNIYVVGEISNLKKHYAGHYYLSLKDENSKINAVMFASNVSKLKYDLKDGMKVVCKCSIGVYIQSGSYQLYITSIEPIGQGDLYAKFEQLKKKLFELGLFDEQKKKKSPLFPANIGVISAPQGAAIQDVISTIKRRWPIANITLLVSLMQGESASLDVINKLKVADKMNFDVIIIARGGGSIEDLWPFNDERLAYIVSEAKTPIISAIGHETDFTILDFVSDKRAPTPTGAAEMATPNIIDVYNVIETYKKRLITTFNKNLINKTDNFHNIKNRLSVNTIERSFELKFLQLDSFKSRLNNIITKQNQEIKLTLNSYQNRLNNSYDNIYKNIKQKYVTLVTKLNAMSPLNVIERGYSIVTNDRGKVVNDINIINIDENLQIRVRNGEISATVKGVKSNGKN